MAEHEITLGSLVLSGDASLPDLDHGYWFEAVAEGMSFGSPQAVTEIVRSLLSDGDLVRVTRFGNREVPIRVVVHGPDLASVNEGERALRNEIGKANVLTWQPPDDLAPPSAFEVVTSWMDPVFNDFGEAFWREREFAVTLTCAPFARSVDLTTVSPLEVGTSTVTTIDTCDSATGWSATVNGSPTTVDMAWSPGSVSVYELLDPAPQTLTLRRTASLSFADARFLVAEIGYNSELGQLPVTLNVTTSSSTRPGLRPISIRMMSAGWYEYVWDLSGTTSTTSLTFVSYTPNDFADLKIRNLSKTGAPPSLAKRQTTRILDVGGTERTPGSLHISSPNGTTPLGLVLVSTYPEKGQGFSPPLSRWYTTGTRTADATSVSGYRFGLDFNYVVFDVPDVSLPEGGYQMVGLVRSSVAMTCRMQSIIQTKQDGVQLADDTHDEATTLPANDWTLVDLGVFTLPTHRTVSGAVFSVALRGLTLTGETLSGVTLEAMDVWLFPVDEDCGLTAVLTPKPHLWLDSPTVSTGTPQIWEGDDESRAGARYPINGVHTPGLHTLPTGRVGTFVAASGVDYPKPEWSYYKRWHSNAAE